MNNSNRRLFVWPHELRESGVLGINYRNLAFIQESNPRTLYPRVDDKTVTKTICHAHGIPVPETFAIVRRYGDVRRLMDFIGERPEFVLKPASGSAGRGIIVVARRKGADFETPSGLAMVRLPTIQSEGRANLHQGAAAAAVHLVTGRTFGGVCNSRMISRHPDTGELIGGFGRDEAVGRFGDGLHRC
jgi:hypothetical protein